MPLRSIGSVRRVRILGAVNVSLHLGMKSSFVPIINVGPDTQAPDAGGGADFCARRVNRGELKNRCINLSGNSHVPP
jgi:hypothetical protein